jgi:hypothetical protein
VIPEPAECVPEATGALEPFVEPEDALAEAPADLTLTSGVDADTLGVRTVTAAFEEPVDTGVFTGTVGVFAGTVGVFTGTVGVFAGTVGVFAGTVGVFTGGVLTVTGGVSTVTGEALTVTGGTSTVTVGTLTGGVFSGTDGVSRGRLNDRADAGRDALAISIAESIIETVRRYRRLAGERVIPNSSNIRPSGSRYFSLRAEH